LTEFAFPIRYGENVRAVLLAGGQLAPTDDEGVAKVKAEILGLPKGTSLWDSLEPALDAESMAALEEGVVAEERLQEVESLGNALQRIVDQLFEARMETAKRVVMEAAQDTLARADLASRNAWWSAVSGLFPDFCQVIGLQEMRVYVRRRSRFHRLDATPTNSTEREIVTARDVLSALEKGRLVRLDLGEGHSDKLLDPLGLRDSVTHAYMTEHRGERVTTSTLMLMTGGVPKQRQRLVEDFCDMAGNRLDVASLVFLLKDAQQDYRIRVGSVAHSFRTPLQSFLLDLHHLSTVSAVRDDSDLLKRVRESSGRVLEAKADIEMLLEEAAEKWEIVDISDLVKGVVNDLRHHVLFQRVWHKTVVQLSNSLLTGKWQRGLPKL